MRKDLHSKARARLARERSRIVADSAAAVRVALAYPNVYRVGMASLGFQIVYEMLNALPDVSCERAFLPDPSDLLEHDRTRTELFTLESLSPLARFDVVAFSISFELDCLNVLRMLRLANIPLRSRDRDESRPLIIAGGPCPTFNPEPMAEFIDAFVIGEAEDVLQGLTETILTERRDRDRLLEALARVPGVYVPRLYAPRYGVSGEYRGVEALPPAPHSVVRSVARDLSTHPASSSVRTPDAEFGDLDLVEVGRGCGRQCRFCVAGYVARPPRFREIGQIPAGDRLGLVGAAVFDRPDAADLCERIVEAGREFTVSSVRLETVTPQLARLMARGGQKTLTIAPEAAADRLRAVINKCATDEQVFAAVAAARDAGIRRVKLYFMIGLPLETDEDVNAICGLARRLTDAFPETEFHFSVSSFVPKPWTPFQWHPMAPEDEIKRRFSLIRRGLTRAGRVELSGESPRLAAVQGLLARGDRRLADVLVAALAYGGDYRAALRETGVDSDSCLRRPHERDEVLPWDHIDARISKDYLWNEYQKALRREPTQPCEVGACWACGVCC